MVIITIMLEKLTEKEFKIFQNHIWEYFGNIGKDKITMEDG